MWTMIVSLDPFVDTLAPAFTQPSLATTGRLLLAWIMCLGRHNLLRVAKCGNPQVLHDNSQRHGFDTFYNYFERSVWTVSALAQRIGILILTRLNILGTVTLLVDDTLAHKRGKCVWGLGWFRDAVASTRKRVATASGHNWVVVAVAFCSPFSGAPILALPLLARLHQSGKGQPSCSELAGDMVREVVSWFPGRRFNLVGDGAYASKVLLQGLPEQASFVGRMRGDAAIYDPCLPSSKPGKKGRKAKKGQRLPSPREVAKKADRKRSKEIAGAWRDLWVTIYGKERWLKIVSFEALWPTVLGPRLIQIVVVRDVEGRMDDVYLFTTDLQANPQWVVTQFSWRWAIEVLFKASKQVMDIEAPQHWAQASVEKLAPWVWSMQSLIMVWYLTAGHTLPEAAQLRDLMGAWDSEWSLHHMLQVLKLAIMNATINPISADAAQLKEMVETLKNLAIQAA
jgi:hypothetical protein